MKKQNQTKKEKAIVNFKKAQSHLAKVIKMAESGDYCIDIMQQNLAVIGLLRSAHELTMANHLETCFKSAMESANEKKKQEMIEEILKVVRICNK
jgi:CsoR family transcriptional regulator, copper-sensing transcriptional repressor